MFHLLNTYDLVLIEAAVVERLRRGGEVALHPRLLHAPLLYDSVGRRALRSVFQDYISIAKNATLPLILCTPTWRANRERVLEAGIDTAVNRDAVRFMRDFRDENASGGPPVKIGGIIGCKNDCYKPEEGLPADESERFHSWQLEQLAGTDIDFLIAETLPALGEAFGIARAMAATAAPYIISFVINRAGYLLDGTPLRDAIQRIDNSVSPSPLGFMVNCAHPSFLHAAEQPPELYERLIGYQANASSLDHADLDGAGELYEDDISEWGEMMLRFHKEHGIKLLGGCCGTGEKHLQYIADHWRDS